MKEENVEEEWSDWSNIPTENYQNDDLNNTNNCHIHGTRSPQHPLQTPITQNEVRSNTNTNSNNNGKSQDFWWRYDEILILSLCSQLGVFIRKMFNLVFGTEKFYLVFNQDSALSANLPVNALALFCLGLLCSGNEALRIIRPIEYSPAEERNNQILDPALDITVDDSLDEESEGLISEEHRYVVYKRYKRSIQASMCLTLFPASLEECDALEHYSDLDLDGPSGLEERPSQVSPGQMDQSNDSVATTTMNSINTNISHLANSINNINISNINLEHTFEDLEQNITTLAEGWDKSHSAEDMKATLLIGLRIGFCGALSTFSSFNEDMINLIRGGNSDAGFVGYALGVIIPLVCYRIGVSVALSLFLQRKSNQLKKLMKLSIGLEVNQVDDDDEEADVEVLHNNNLSVDEINEMGKAKREAIDENNFFDEVPVDDAIQQREVEEEPPSIRAAVTALFSLLVIGQITSLFIFAGSPSLQAFSISLLFSPFGVLARRKLMQYNYYKIVVRKGDDFVVQKVEKDFPIGTWLCNVLGCALAGKLGAILAGNTTGEKNTATDIILRSQEGQIVLQSMIFGFAGSLSTLASLIVEVLHRIDILLSKYSGVTYCLSTIFWGFLIGFISSLL